MNAPSCHDDGKSQWASLLALLLGLLATGCGRLPGQPKPADRPVRPDQVLDFRTLFAQNCRGCHGADGRLGPAPPLNDKLFLAIVPDEELKRVIANGRKDTLMAAFANNQEGGHLTAPQIDALALGLRSEWGGKPDISAPLPSYLAGTERGDAAAGAEVFTMACAGCHGDKGQGGTRAGAINSQAFLDLVSDQFLRRIVITGRPDLGMPNFADPATPPYRPKNFQALSNEDVTNVVALLASWRKAAQRAGE